MSVQVYHNRQVMRYGVIRALYSVLRSLSQIFKLTLRIIGGQSKYALTS
jgi:hypothetical protein